MRSPLNRSCPHFMPVPRGAGSDMGPPWPVGRRGSLDGGRLTALALGGGLAQDSFVHPSEDGRIVRGSHGGQAARTAGAATPQLLPSDRADAISQRRPRPDAPAGHGVVPHSGSLPFEHTCDYATPRMSRGQHRAAVVSHGHSGGHGRSPWPRIERSEPGPGFPLTCQARRRSCCAARAASGLLAARSSVTVTTASMCFISSASASASVLVVSSVAT